MNRSEDRVRAHQDSLGVVTLTLTRTSPHSDHHHKARRRECRMGEHTDQGDLYWCRNAIAIGVIPQNSRGQADRVLGGLFCRINDDSQRKRRTGRRATLRREFSTGTHAFGRHG